VRERALPWATPDWGSNCDGEFANVMKSLLHKIGRKKKNSTEKNIRMRLPSGCTGDEAHAEAHDKRSVFILKRLLAYGFAMYWDYVERLLDNYHELRDTPEERPVLSSVAPPNTRINRKRRSQTMLETFNVSAKSIVIQAALLLYVSGYTTDLVMDFGDGVAHSASIYKGFESLHAILCLVLTGRDLTKYVMKILLVHSQSFTIKTARVIVRDIKEKLPFIAVDFNSETKVAKESSNKVKIRVPPVEYVVTIGIERPRCLEVPLNPNLIGKEASSIRDTTSQLIGKSAVDTYAELRVYIVLFDGITLFTGVGESADDTVVPCSCL
jgi:hypothetical protein